MRRETEDGYKRTNREMAMEPDQAHAGWCFGCDGAKVFEGSKCPVCGTRMALKKKSKKIVVRD